MIWIIHSLAMFFSSVILYLLIRKAQILKIPYQVYSIYMFGIPMIGYFLMAIAKDISFSLGFYEITLIILSAIFFSYLGNIFSMKGIESSPNPGYSLILSKSYVILTSILSVFLFHSELTWKSIIAILCIIAFSAMISISKATKHPTNHTRWVLYSLGAFLCWAGLALISKYFINIGVEIIIRLLYLAVVVTGLIFVETRVKKISLKTANSQLGLLIGIGIMSMLFNLFMQLGYQTAPNPGYINALNASSISLLTLLSAYFYKDELTTQKIIGVFGVTAGMILLFI